RLGAYPCKLVDGTKAKVAYDNKDMIEERHRHRYEFNHEYLEQMEEAGFVASGMSPDGNLVEIIELKDHPWFVACQFHPEFTSRPTRAQPLFKGLISAAVENATNK